MYDIIVQKSVILVYTKSNVTACSIIYQEVMLLLFVPSVLMATSVSWTLIKPNITYRVYANKQSTISIKISHKFITKHSIDNKSALAPNRRQTIAGTNAGPVQWRIYAALGEIHQSFICYRRK